MLALQTPSRSTPTLAAVDLRGCKVLVADDNVYAVRVLGHMLSREGYTIQTAGSAKRVLARYPEFQPHLILLDAELPGDGFLLCRTLKETYGPECAAIMFLTSKAASDDIVAGLEAGAVDYLRKPFNPTEVLARIRAQLRYRLLLERQASLVADLNQVNADKNRLLGLAAHDLHVPLASIRQLAEFLRDGTLGTVPAEQRDFIESIHDTTQSMLSMVNELVDVVAIESGEMKIVPEPTNLGLLLDRAAYVANVSAAKKNTRILFITPIGTGQVSLDPGKMKQVVDNLLSNAVKFSPPGSIITMGMHVDAASGSYSFCVRDQGPGIPEKERDKLFKDFGQLSVKPTAGEKSTGLGLAICRKIVLAHGGTIEAVNLPAGGAEFRVAVPAPSS